MCVIQSSLWLRLRLTLRKVWISIWPRIKWIWKVVLWWLGCKRYVWELWMHLVWLSIWLKIWGMIINKNLKASTDHNLTITYMNMRRILREKIWRISGSGDMAGRMILGHGVRIWVHQCWRQIGGGIHVIICWDIFYCAFQIKWAGKTFIQWIRGARASRKRANRSATLLDKWSCLTQ